MYRMKNDVRDWCSLIVFYSNRLWSWNHPKHGNSDWWENFWYAKSLWEGCAYYPKHSRNMVLFSYWNTFNKRIQYTLKMNGTIKTNPVPKSESNSLRTVRQTDSKTDVTRKLRVKRTTDNRGLPVNNNKDCCTVSYNGIILNFMEQNVIGCNRSLKWEDWGFDRSWVWSWTVVVFDHSICLW